MMMPDHVSKEERFVGSLMDFIVKEPERFDLLADLRSLLFSNVIFSDLKVQSYSFVSYVSAGCALGMVLGYGPVDATSAFYGPLLGSCIATGGVSAILARRSLPHALSWRERLDAFDSYYPDLVERMLGGSHETQGDA